MDFEIVGQLRDVETIASGRAIRGAAAASEVLRAGSMAEDERSCYDSAAKRADRRGGAALVRGARNRTEGIQDQEAVDFTMTRTRKKKSFVVCLSNDGYAASLEPRKIYVALRDAAAERNGLLRVVDESGEDYLYARDRFAPLKLPRGLQRALAAAA